MKEFISAALPWVAIGLAIAIILTNAVKRTKSRDENNEDQAAKDQKSAENHMTDGLCIGMCMGVALGSTGIIDLATGISLGMLLGLAVGMCIKKGE